MRCIYEVLEVSQEASDADIRAAYRRLARAWHPDKRLAADKEVAEERFAEIQAAYDVLRDSQERAWYDSHRQSLLACKGVGSGSEPPESTVNDSPHTEVDFVLLRRQAALVRDPAEFFRTFGPVFGLIAKEEVDAEARQQGPRATGQTQPAQVPLLGNAASTDGHVASFYSYWGAFQTVRDYVWLDAHDPASAPHRRARRLLEGENAKRRRQARKALNAAVRDLTEAVRSADPRVTRSRGAADWARGGQRRHEQISSSTEAVPGPPGGEAGQPRRGGHGGYRDPEWVVQSERLARAELEAEQLTAACSGPQCYACEVHFRNERALQRHERSPQHAQQVARLRAMLLADEAL